MGDTRKIDLKGKHKMTTTKLRKGTVRHIEEELFDYHETVKRIKERRDELMSNTVPEGRTVVEAIPDFEPLKYQSSTERLGIRLASDKKLQEMERIAKAIEYVYNACDDERKKLIRIKYWMKPQKLTWEGIAAELHISRATAFRWRDEILQALTERLGWY